MLANENPYYKSELADVQHQVSVDDGGSWHDIQPQHRVSFDTPEIIEVNTNKPDSIQTKNPVYSVRHRMLFKRSPEKFKDGASSTLKRTIKTGTDLLGIPSLSPLELSLTKTPLPDTLVLMNPLWSIRVDNTQSLVPFKKFVGVSTGDYGMRFELPLDFTTGQVDIDEVVIWVDDDDSWELVPVFDANNKDKKVFIIDEKGILKFGDEDISNSNQPLIPRNGATISYSLTEERLSPSASTPHICYLNFETDGDKENVSIFYMDDIQTASVDLVPGSRVNRLGYKNILNFSVAPPGTEKAYYFGIVLNPGEYAVDYSNGIIYSGDEIPKSSTTSVEFTYQPKVKISTDDWYFVETPDNAYSKIAIKDSGYKSFSISDTDISTLDPSALAGNKMFFLGKKSIVPGSISGISKSLPPNSIPKEVPFINGVDEFKNFSSGLNISGYYSVDYKNGIVYYADQIADASAKVSFSYTEMYAQYNIAKRLDLSEYTYDSKTNKISISEREALRVWGPTRSSQSNDSLIKAIYDYVLTTRESIEDLEPYFSPIVRDYVLKIFPKETK